MTFLFFALAQASLADDTWTEIRPGIDYLHRTTSTPQDIHAVRIDLARPEISVRASRDATGTERQVTTSTFAASVGATVAINGDWSNGSTPVGLAIGNWWKWHDHLDDSSIGASWGYVACDAFNDCTIESLPLLSEAWWFSPTISPYRYVNAVGANGLLLLQDGVRMSGCYDGCSGDSCRHPRSAACIDESGTTLWLIVADGRRSDAAGMTCGEMRDLAQDLGCWNAAMLDGGGSSTLVVDGAVKNQPSDGSQRTVANHLGIVWTETADGACAERSGAWCDGTWLRACTGGVLFVDGDCAAYGAGCQEDGDWAFCVDPRCPGGDGMGAACLDETWFAGCTDGVYGEGDCGAFGLLCGTDAMGSACMQAECVDGPHSGHCVDETSWQQCTDGIYAAGSCDEGLVCEDATGVAQCVDPDSAGDGGSADGGAGGGDGGAEGSGEPAGDRVPLDEVGKGCGLGLQAGALGTLLALLAVGRRRR